MKNSLAKKQPEFSLAERQKRKNLDGEYISRVLRFSSDSRLVQGTADKIWACCQKDNLYTADDLHNEETGEMFDGRGQLWACNSRLCPVCVGKLSKRNRKIARHVIDNRKDVLVGTEWFFITLTMPDLSLKGLSLLECRSVINEAWRNFQRSKWFKDISRGGIKSEEFTVGEYKQYHYHLHLLAICRFRITSNNFREIREVWTEYLKSVFEKRRNLKFECNTSDGLAVCHVQKVWNKEKAILEICKYLTKSTDWAKTPPAQLAEIATIKRFPRMFEVFGVCKERAKEIRPKARNTQDKENTYLDTKKITVSENTSIENQNFDATSKAENISVNGQTSNSNAPPKKKLTWREHCRILPREEWLQHLENEILGCQTFRKRQLREKFAFASFKTLDGEEF